MSSSSLSVDLKIKKAITMEVVKRNGTRERVSFDKVTARIECICTPELFPCYVVTTKKGQDWTYLIHPDEKEHMERYLAGTDDPMYDLVHELRYNPQFSVVNETKESFETKKRKINENDLF